jgi:hypothetical protein
MKILLISLLFFPALQAADSMRGFCFRPGTDLQQVNRSMKPYLKSGERPDLRFSTNCVEMKMSQGRFDLFQTVLGRRFVITNTYKGAGAGVTSNPRLNRPAQNCRVTVTRSGSGTRGTDDWNVKKGGAFRTSNSKSSGNSITNLTLMEGKPGRIQVSGESVELICHKRGSSWEMSVAVAKSGGGNLLTTVMVGRGEQVNLGDIVQNLRDQHRSIDINSGVGYRKGRRKENHRYFLRVE